MRGVPSTRSFRNGMSVSIVTFANLGKKTNLKTSDILPVIDVFSAHGELKQVVCQINSDFYFPNTSSAVPISVRYPLRALEKFFHFSLARRATVALFDYFAQKKMIMSDMWMLHPGSVLPRSFQRAHRLGAISVNIATTAHFQTNTSLETEELTALNYRAYEGTYSRYDKEFTHGKGFDYVIAISEFVKRSYIQTGFPSDKIFVAHIDIPGLERFNPRGGKRNGMFRVLYLAHTTPLKGLHYLLEAWNDLHLSNAELVLVGGYGDMPEELKRRYDAIITQNSSIQCIGSSATPEQYYRDASVFVFPSLTEGFGRVTLEAMACGLPVITTENAKGIVEDGKTGFVVPIRDANAMKEKIAYLYHHPDIAEQMGLEARKAVENKKSFGEAVYEIYREILRREHKL